MLSSNCFAGKIKSADNLLPKIEAEIKEVQGIISEVKTYMNGIGETGSFVKNDFWGITPVFYFARDPSQITNLYFLHKIIERRIRREDKNRYFLRKINNINLYPTSLENWKVDMNFDSRYLFPDEWSELTSSNNLNKYFFSNNVPAEKIQAATDEYVQYYDKTAMLIFSEIGGTIDAFYNGVYYDEFVTQSRSFLKFFTEAEAIDMKKHPGIMKAKRKEFQSNSLHELLFIQTQDELFKKIATGEKNRMMTLGVSVSIYRYHFEVGKAMDSSTRISQIIDFDLLLKKKLDQGKAVSSTVKRKGHKTDFIAYSDIPGSVKHPATILFDKETGEGIWQTGYWNTKSEVEKLKLKFTKANEQLKIYFQQYLKMKMKEIANKYASKLDESSFNDEF